MNEFCEIHWSSGSIDEARKISRYLAQERLIAGAQIIPWVETIYMWNNQLETVQESKIILKAPKVNCKRIEEIIKENSSYQIPEILYFNIEGGSEDYLVWAKESTPQRSL
ncbi:MAG: divalent-cation tolerance protein CutA [Parachlamydiaceae bacterium]|nr:divalent-cation tolerance protein CutA [Parachlamydiaceae bacterium]